MKIKLFTNSGIFDRSVSLDGFTMTGFMTLSRNPMTGQEAATKRYVDNFPYNLAVENITGGPVAIERFAPGISGDIAMYNSNQTVLKSVAAAGSYGRVTVNGKGQVVSGLPSSSELTAPTLMFSEITGRPTVVSGYAADPTVYIRNTTGVDNVAFTGALTLSRAPTTGTELASYGYLTSQVNTIVGGYKVGEVVLKPNTVAQTGFLKANGGILDKTTYAALYAVVGDTYSSAGGGAGGYMGQPWRQQSAFNLTDNGVSQTWTTATSLPGTVYLSQAIVTNSRVYLLGGHNGSYSSTVYTAPIASDGTLGTWTTATSLPGTVYLSQAIVTQNRVYLLGGYINGADSSTVYSAPFSGGSNDYLTLIANNTVNTTTQFKLPDTSLTDPAGSYSYIRAV
jgi:microcystin-dependent protein